VKTKKFIPEPKPEPKVVEKVILLEDVHFDLDKSTLTKEAQTILKRNIQVLKENPNVRIRIQGHTSAIATEEYNQKLSERRSHSVEEFLIKEGGIAPDRLTEIGYGETRLEKPEPNPEIKESEAAKTNRRVSAITFAEHSVHLTNAYFIPDDQILDAFTDAARRGVDVKIILPATSDSSLALYAMRYNYSELLKSGVKLFERRNALLHAKTAVIDGVWSTVGSTNMDFWSFLSDDEVNAVILSHEFAGEMEKMFARDIAESDQIQWEEWKKRPLFQRIRECFAHLFSHWL